MSLSPQQIRTATFKQAKRGYDQVEVESFIAEAADALEAAQNESTAMEARARAAVARLQELSQGGALSSDGSSVAGAEPFARAVAPDEAETISRTLLLAQRTADTAMAEAQAEADRIRAAAQQEADSVSSVAAEERARLIDAARVDARKASESARVHAEGEVQALLARRDFLESDVDHLEQHLVAQRDRIREAAAELQAVVEGGLGDMRRPLLSAADVVDEVDEVDEVDDVDDVEEGDDEQALDDLDGSGELDEITRAAAAEPGDDARPADVTPSSGASSLFEDHPELGIARPWEDERR